MPTDFFWKIEQSVGHGLYIVHDDVFATQAAAEKEAALHPNARAVLYMTGRGHGAVRAVTEDTEGR